MQVRDLIQTLRYLDPEVRVSLPSGETPSIRITDEWRIGHRSLDTGSDEEVIEYLSNEMDAEYRVTQLRAAGHH